MEIWVERATRSARSNHGYLEKPSESRHNPALARRLLICIALASPLASLVACESSTAPCASSNSAIDDVALTASEAEVSVTFPRELCSISTSIEELVKAWNHEASAEATLYETATDEPLAYQAHDRRIRVRGYQLNRDDAVGILIALANDPDPGEDEIFSRPWGADYAQFAPRIKSVLGAAGLSDPPIAKLTEWMEAAIAAGLPSTGEFESDGIQVVVAQNRNIMQLALFGIAGPTRGT